MPPYALRPGRPLLPCLHDRSDRREPASRPSGACRSRRLGDQRGVHRQRHQRHAREAPCLDALLADARRRKLDLIAVAALDRLGRNLRHLVVLLDELQHLGVGLVSLREALDLTSPIGRAMFALVGVLAEVERAWIVERTHAGLRRARAQGKQLGRRRIITDLSELRQLLVAGSSYRAAARHLGVSEGSVRRAVRENRILVGARAPGWRPRIRSPNPLIKRCGESEADAHQDTLSLWNLDEME